MTSGIAEISILCIPVVALFNPFLHHSISTTGISTRQAGIRINIVFIIAFFLASLNKGISAGGRLAIHARVCVDCIPIIAPLPDLEDAVAAGGGAVERGNLFVSGSDSYSTFNNTIVTTPIPTHPIPIITTLLSIEPAISAGIEIIEETTKPVPWNHPNSFLFFTNAPRSFLFLSFLLPLTGKGGSVKGD